MHCLLIHQAFAGPGDPGGTRHFEVAKVLSGEGHRFTIVTGSINYLTGERRVVTGVNEGAEGRPRVVTAWVPSTLHRSFVWRVLAFLVFSISSFVRALCVRDVDVVLGTSPPIFQAASAWAVALLKRVPFVLEVRDLWPEFAVDMGVLRNPVLIWLARRLENFLYSRATVIVVNSPAYRTYLVGRGVNGDRVFVVPNGVDVTMFDPDMDPMEGRSLLGLDSDAFVVMYAGALGMANDIGTILRAAEILEDLPNIRFVLAGDGKERANLEKSAEDSGLENVYFPGSFPKSEIPRLLAAADVCVATLMNIPMFATTYPNKVFDYMAAGRPTVLGIDGVIREVVEAANGGIFVPPGDGEALADAVRTLAADPEKTREYGRSARGYVERRFDRAGQARRFGEILAEVAKGRG